MYADDTVLYTADTNFEDSMKNMRADPGVEKTAKNMITDKTKTKYFVSANMLNKKCGCFFQWSQPHFLHSDSHITLWVGTVCGCIEYVGLKYVGEL